MPEPAAILKIAETIDLSPEALSEQSFVNELSRTVGSLSGQFVDRATQRGINRSRAAEWLGETQDLIARAGEGLNIDDAADLAVRLYAASFLISYEVADTPSEDLLIDATPRDQEPTRFPEPSASSLGAATL